MKYLIAISGPVAVGKSVLADEFLKRFRTHRISTRQILIDAGIENERGALIEAGKDLDVRTDGAWVRDGILPYLIAQADKQVVLIDAVRTARQIHHLREAFGERFVHIHVSAPLEVVRERYEARDAATDKKKNYDEVRADPTESGVWRLGLIADRQVENHRCGPKSVLARAVAGLSLFPDQSARLVDVYVGGQYGSEGKGNICSHLACEYDILVRVGGPNAGHKAAFPDYKYVQIPSGTGARRAAKEPVKILIGPGSTIWVPTILREIKDWELKKGEIVIDEQAIIIEQTDKDWEEKMLGVIGSTKQGVGVAAARKILGRDGKDHLGAKVRLAKHHPDLQDYIGSTSRELDDAFTAGVPIMLEGTQGTSLSIHHGCYPSVTSRETSVAGCLADAGIAPSRVRRVVMVTRTYPIRVGGTSGPVDIEIDAQVIADRSGLPVSQIQKTEVGTVSNNPRRIAEFDWEQLRRSVVLNGATDIALTFSDYIAAENQSAVRFDQLSAETKSFIAEVEHVAGVPVSLISTGFHRFCVIDRRSWQ